MRDLERKKRIAEMRFEEKKLKFDIVKTKHYLLFNAIDYIKNGSKVIRVDTFTKKWINRLLWFGCIWITMSYHLAYMGKYSIAETLSQTVCTTVIATVLGYLIKAFFETFFEKKNEVQLSEIETKINENQQQIIPVSVFTGEEDSVG
ncbi:hypothetical protein [Kineothrix sedimenti]|uniref:Uncharacterized protein n=1 Tax=Kineothrix sedimenti TaxID=3123317 RepID=A0ABZ3F1Y2_9FIRM